MWRRHPDYLIREAREHECPGQGHERRRQHLVHRRVSPAAGMVLLGRRRRLPATPAPVVRAGRLPVFQLTPGPAKGHVCRLRWE